MIFEKDSIAFQILDVLFLDQTDTKMYNYNRNFDALSFRYEADTVISYNNKQIEFTDNSIGFFPADTDYVRTSKKDKLIVAHFKTFNYQGNEIETFIPSNPEKYKEIFKELLDCWNKKSTSYKHRSAALLNTIFAELYHDNKKIYNRNSKIDCSIRYIEENCLSKNFSLTIAAEKSFISETYFRKLFKQEFDISPKQYVIKKRIKYAASLIISGYYTLEEIAELCGYNDYKHFSVEFKKMTGISPSKYNYNYNEKNTEI